MLSEETRNQYIALTMSQLRIFVNTFFNAFAYAEHGHALRHVIDMSDHPTLGKYAAHIVGDITRKRKPDYKILVARHFDKFIGVATTDFGAKAQNAMSLLAYGFERFEPQQKKMTLNALFSHISDGDKTSLAAFAAIKRISDHPATLDFYQVAIKRNCSLIQLTAQDAPQESDRLKASQILLHGFLSLDRDWQRTSFQILLQNMHSGSSHMRDKLEVAFLNLYKPAKADAYAQAMLPQVGNLQAIIENKNGMNLKQVRRVALTILEKTFPYMSDDQKQKTLAVMGNLDKTKEQDKTNFGYVAAKILGKLKTTALMVSLAAISLFGRPTKSAAAMPNHQARQVTMRADVNGPAVGDIPVFKAAQKISIQQKGNHYGS